MKVRFIGTTALASTVISALPFLGVAHAQRNQPIYPAYEGYLKNPDGSLTLSFAYFSHNAEVVTIEPGERNTFAPTPDDRMQPITFEPGHWRFQCVMVVGPEFDGKLGWTLTYAGTTTSTSERMLQGNWLLVEGASALSKIDYTSVPKGVCLNRAPNVRVLGLLPSGDDAPPSLAASVSEKLPLFGSVHDEGLPRSGKLTSAWTQVSGPGTVTFDNAAEPRTRVTFSAPGTYELVLSASDSELTAETRVRVNVTAGQ